MRPVKEVMMIRRVLSNVSFSRLLLIFASLLVSNSILAKSSEDANVQPEDCGADQYYHQTKSSCRNCTDIIQTLHSYQEWIGREVSDIRKPITDQENNPLNRIQTNGPARFAAEGEIFSRLISVDPQDQEYLDSSQDLSQDLNNIDYNNNDVGGDTSLLASQTRQTQAVVDRFVQSSFIGNELLGAIEQCRQNQNISACQMWSNMCVMTMYSYSDSAPLAASSLTSSSLSSAYQRQHTNNRYKSGGKRQPQKLRTMRTWQMCRQFNVESVCNSLKDWLRIERKSNLDILNIYAADEPVNSKIGHSIMRPNQLIQLLAYKYSYDGRFLGVTQFGLEELEKFCIISNEGFRVNHPMDSHVRLGKNMRYKCQFDPIQALRSPSRIKHFNETVFMDLYIGYPLNGAMFVRPVPILIKNLLYNGIQINRKHQKDPSRWKLVHRFFFHTIMDLDKEYAIDGGVDSSTSGEKQQSSSQVNRNPYRQSTQQYHLQSEQILLYAKSALLDLKFRRQEKGALMSSLLLTLDYGQLPLQDYHDTSMVLDANSSLAIANNATTTTSTTTTASTMKLNSVPLESSVTIIQTLNDMSSYKKDLDLAMTILSILSSIWALIRCYNIQKCYGIVKLDLETLIRFLMIGCDIVANLIAAINLLFLAFLFVALKFQSTVQVLAPTDELESAIVVNLQLAFLFKLIGLVHKLYVMLNVDIFFIDWEKPKMLTSAELLNHNAHYNNHHNAKSSNNTAAANNSSSMATTTLDDSSNINHFKWSLPSQQSSFWRPYTIINRWLQMQTLRLHNTTLQLFLFVCIVNLTQVIKLATLDPSLDFGWANSNSAEATGGGQPAHVHQLSPYISTTFRILILSIIYVCLSLGQILYKKYFHEPMIRNRVDEFVDLCSVANVSLFCMLYPRFGYYIHGRNANGSGDCGIGEVNALLEREERDLCSKRGLAQNSDQQTFVLILPKIINDHYRKLLFRDYDHLLLSSTHQSNIDNNISGQLNKQSLNVSAGRSHSQNKFMGNSNSFLKSALNLSIATSSSQSFSSNRTIIETMLAKNRAINLFLTNFLEHIYKDIDYSIRDRRRFESLQLGIDFDDEMLIGNRNLGPLSAVNGGAGGGNGLNVAGGLTGISALENNPTNAATFCKDPTNSFTSLLWLGLEFDLVFVELFSLLTLDLWLGQPLVITCSLVLLLHQSFKALYVACARHNLIAKALVDEKFLFG